MEKLTEILHELSDIYEEGKKKTLQQSAHPRISTDRNTDEVPALTPLTFAINQNWYNEHKDDPDFKLVLGDWEKHCDPPGWAESWADRIE